MKISAFVFGLAVLAAGPSVAKNKVSLQTAEAMCLEQVRIYADTPYTYDMELPHPHQVKDKFCACVWANSGAYPESKLVVRGVFVSLAAGG